MPIPPAPKQSHLYATEPFFAATEVILGKIVEVWYITCLLRRVKLWTASFAYIVLKMGNQDMLWYCYDVSNVGAIWCDTWYLILKWCDVILVAWVWYACDVHDMHVIWCDVIWKWCGMTWGGMLWYGCDVHGMNVICSDVIWKWYDAIWVLWWGYNGVI